MASSAPFVEHQEFVDVFLQPFLSFNSKANRAERYVEKKARNIFRGKWFADGDAKGQIYEFRDDKTKVYFMVPREAPPRERRVIPKARGMLRLEKTVFAQ